MVWNLFIDDERFPPDDGRSWQVARNKEQVLQLLRIFGEMPTFISFDHDLGDEEPTGYDIAKYLVDLDLDGHLYFDVTNFNFYVHSQNPVGKQNIEKYLGGYLKMIREIDVDNQANVSYIQSVSNGETT